MIECRFLGADEPCRRAAAVYVRIETAEGHYVDERPVCTEHEPAASYVPAGWGYRVSLRSTLDNLGRVG